MIISIVESRYSQKAAPASPSAPNKPQEPLVKKTLSNLQDLVEIMPSTTVELYSVAANAMLSRVDNKERGAAASNSSLPHLTALLEATFFQAHTAQRRVIELEHLEAAAVELAAPVKLARIRWPEFEGRATCGQWVKIVRGEYRGQSGVIIEDDDSRNPYKVAVYDGRGLRTGVQTPWLFSSDVVSSGLTLGLYGATHKCSDDSEQVRSTPFC